VRVKFEVVPSPPHCERDKKIYDWVYKLDTAQLPEHTLRVLDLDNCRLEESAAVSFPRLSSLRLCKCSSSAKDLEGWIRTAPSLGTMHIQDHDFLYDDTRRFALHSPSLTALTIVLRPCFSTREHFEVVDAPRLRTFKYKGTLDAFSMKSQTRNLERVDLTTRRFYDETGGSPVKIWFAPFWKLLRNFRHVKAIKLKVPNIDGIAVVDKDVRHQHLFTLPGLERLELRGFLDPAGRTDDAALAIANLLQCCPVLHDLLIRIPTDPYRALYETQTSTQVRVYMRNATKPATFMDCYRVFPYSTRFKFVWIETQAVARAAIRRRVFFSLYDRALKKEKGGIGVGRERISPYLRIFRVVN
jgi:hypothetical protein